MIQDELIRLFFIDNKRNLYLLHNAHLFLVFVQQTKIMKTFLNPLLLQIFYIYEHSHRQEE